MPPRNNRQILGLDLLRAFAALLVMLFHYTFWNFVHDPVMRPLWPPAFRVLAPVSSAGWVGVEIFFVISGFVITFSSENIRAARFVQHRLTRLLPSAVICATLTAFSVFAVGPLPRGLIALLWLRSIVFWPKSPWIDGSYWTLPIEISFYFIVFLCLAFNRRLLGPAMATLAAVSTVWNLRPLPAHPSNTVFLLRHGCLFATGVFLYQTLTYGWRPLRTLALGVALTGSLFEVGRHKNPVADVLWLAGMALLLASVLFNEPLQRAVGRRSSALIRNVGLTTYPFYLLHDSAGSLMIVRLHDRLGLGYREALLITVVTMVGASVLIMRYGEPKLRTRMVRLLGWQSTHATAQGTTAAPLGALAYQGGANGSRDAST